MEPTSINTQLEAKASIALQKEIEEELNIPDPVEEKSIAKLLQQQEFSFEDKEA